MNRYFIHNKPYTTNVKIFRHNILVVFIYSLMDCKETVKCINFLLHPYKYINIIMLHYYISQNISAVSSTTRLWNYLCSSLELWFCIYVKLEIIVESNDK